MQAQKAYLVETIPVGMDDLRVTKGLRYTETELKRLTDRTKNTIDLTVMYWNLLPRSDSQDESGFTAQQFEAFGAGYGRSLYNALRRAARRGVTIRILQSRGFDDPGAPGPSDQESDRIAREFPEQVQMWMSLCRMSATQDIRIYPSPFQNPI